MMVYAIWGLSALAVLLGCAVVFFYLDARSIFHELIDSDEDNARLQGDYRAMWVERDRLRLEVAALEKTIEHHEEGLGMSERTIDGLLAENSVLRDKMNQTIPTEPAILFDALPDH